MYVKQSYGMIKLLIKDKPKAHFHMLCIERMMKMSKKLNKQLPKGIREKNGSYEARAMINGFNICLHGKDLEALVQEFELAKEQARKNIDYRTSDMSLNEWFESWMNNVKSKKVKEVSIAPMKRSFNRTFGFYIGQMKLNDIRPMDVQLAINAMEKAGTAVSTMRDSLGRMRECMEFAVANRLISYNPCIVIEVPWPDKKTEEEIPFTQEEQNIFLNEVDLENNWYRELFYIMFLTGLRVGEIGGLHWSDVDFKNKCININCSLSCNYLDGVKTEQIVTPKTVNSYRKVPFMGEAEEMLLAQKKKVDALKIRLGKRWRASEELGDLVFVSGMGSPCSRYIVQKEINKVVKRINERNALEAVKSGVKIDTFRHAHPHLFRHTFATRCFESGIEPKVVQALMGHSNISTTLNIYTHVLEEKRMQEVAKFGNAKSSVLPKSDQKIPKITAKSHI